MLRVFKERPERRRRRLLKWERTKRLAAGRDKNSSRWQVIFKCSSKETAPEMQKQ